MKKLLSALIAGAFVMAQAPAVLAQDKAAPAKAEMKKAEDKAAAPAKAEVKKADAKAAPAKADAKAEVKKAEDKAAAPAKTEAKKKKGGC